MPSDGDVSAKEIAAKLGSTPNAARRIIQKAREKMSRLMPRRDDS